MSREHKIPPISPPHSPVSSPICALINLYPSFLAQKLSLGDHWLIYDGETATNPQFAVKKHVNLIGSRSLVHVTACCPGAAKSCLSYEVEGSYSRRCCAVYDDQRRQLAQIKRKEAAAGVALGADVFSLIVEPGFDAAFAMAVVILLDQMFGSRGSLLRV